MQFVLVARFTAKVWKKLLVNLKSQFDVCTATNSFGSVRKQVQIHGEYVISKKKIHRLQRYYSLATSLCYKAILSRHIVCLIKMQTYMHSNNVEAATLQQRWWRLNSFIQIKGGCCRHDRGTSNDLEWPCCSVSLTLISPSDIDGRSAKYVCWGLGLSMLAPS